MPPQGARTRIGLSAQILYNINGIGDLLKPSYLGPWILREGRV